MRPRGRRRNLRPLAALAATRPVAAPQKDLTWGDCARVLTRTLVSMVRGFLCVFWATDWLPGSQPHGPSVHLEMLIHWASTHSGRNRPSAMPMAAPVRPRERVSFCPSSSGRRRIQHELVPPYYHAPFTAFSDRARSSAACRILNIRDTSPMKNRRPRAPSRERRPRRSTVPVSFDMPVILTPEEAAKLLRDSPQPERHERGRGGE